MYAAPDRDTPTTDAWLFLRALRVVLGRTPLWLLTWGALAVLSLPVALPWHDWFRAETEHRYAPGALVHSLDETFRFDHRGDLELLNDITARLGAGLYLVAALVGVFAAGGWLQVMLERTHGQSLRRFFYGGARYFWRFLRFWLLTLVVLAGLHWLLYEWPWKTIVLEWLLQVPAHDLESLDTFESEYDVLRLGWLRDGLFAAGFGMVMVWGTFGRTRLALHDTTSALWAGLCTVFTLLRHPLKTVRPILALLLVELIVVTLVAGGLTRWLDGSLAEDPSWVRVTLMFLIGQLALMWREVTRGAGYYAAIKVSQEIVRPLSRPDPWKSIGGPGGPQYPVGGGGDEYGVAM